MDHGEGGHVQQSRKSTEAGNPGLGPGSDLCGTEQVPLNCKADFPSLTMEIGDPVHLTGLVRQSR